MSILIAIPNMGDIKTELAQFLMDVDKRDDVEVYFSKQRPVDANRNKIANYFLNETDHDWLLMIDDDIIPPDNVLDIIEEFPDKDILSPVIFSLKNGIPYPVASEMKDSPNGERLMMSTGDDTDILELDGVGTGCIFIKREVFGDMEKPYFRFRFNEEGELDSGEDLMFCLDAQDAGHQTWMAMDYVCGHIQNVNFEHLMQLLNAAINVDKEKIFYQETGGKNAKKD